MRRLDLNADVGEGPLGLDAPLIGLVSSVNVACGLHAGDPTTIRRTVALAAAHGVAIGAHPGYDDREGFGRRPRSLGRSELTDLLLYQLGALDAIARAAGSPMRHVKPHGALYNQAEVDEGLAFMLVEAIRTFDPALRFVGRAGSAMESAAKRAGHPFSPEAFADRRYRADGTLQPRAEAGALLTDPEEVARQVRRLLSDGEVEAVDGRPTRVAFETLCLHGDTPDAARLAARVRAELIELGVEIAAPG